MTQIIVPQRRVWTRQPQSIVGIDWSNPITQTIAAAFVPACGMTDLVRNDITLQTNTAGNLKNTNGAWVSNTDASTLTATVGSGRIVAEGAKTIVWVGRLLGSYVGAYNALICGVTYTNNDYYPYINFGIMRGIDGGNFVGVRTQNTNAVTTTHKTGVDQVYVAVFDGSNQYLYIDGVLAASGVVASYSYTAAAQLKIGGYIAGSGRSSNIETRAAVFFNRGFGTEEIKKVSANPWQLFTRRPRRTIIDLGSGGSTDHSLTPSGIVTGSPVLGSPSVTQDHVVGATGIATASPTLGSPALTQDHVVTATGIATAAPILGTPTLADVPAGVIGANGIVTGAPVLGTPALTQNHALSAGAIAAGSPIFGPVTLEQQHALLADGFATGSPVLGSPSLSSGVPSMGLSDEDVARIAAAVLAALQTTSVPIPSNATHMNGAEIIGDGSEANPWRGVGVSP